MIALAVPALDIVAKLAALGVPRIARLDPSAETAPRISAALDHAISRYDRAAVAQVNSVSPSVKVAAAQPTTANDASVGPTTDANAQERATRALQLDPPKTPAGDTILDGLQKLRGVFDAQQGRINSVMSQPVTDVNTLMAMQMEIANFSLMVDVTSKLTGKSTQTLEVLLKGQ